jgi:hypothetical protein
MEIVLPDYSVKFLVHLIPQTKPEGWDNPVVHDTFVSANSFQNLKEMVNNEIGAFIKQRGVVILKEPKKPLEDNIETMDLRLFIPIHMVSYISTSTKRMTTDMPNLSDDNLFLQ